jgi:hypothetical protein
MGMACNTNRNAYRVLVGKSEGKRPVGALDVGGRIILKWIVEKYDGVVWIGFVWLSIGISGGLL